MKAWQVFLGIIIIAILIVMNICLSFNDHSYIVKVTEKVVKVGDKSSIYLIFCEKIKTEEIIVFKNTDNWSRLKFNSSDVYGRIKVGKMYWVTVVGFRVPIFSMYENIIRVETYEDGF